VATSLVDAAAVRGDPGLWADLRTLLDATYDTGALERATGIRPLSLLSLDRLSECRVRLDGHPARTTMVELFVLGSGVTRGEAEQALTPLDLDRLERSGLVDVERDLVRARVSILPFDGLWLVGDRLNERGVPQGQRVPNTDLSTLLTSSVVSRQPAGSMLDLGTGTGVHALCAARHCASVTGVDINPRALTYARFNAGINDVTTAEWIEGGFFDELDGRSFDLVVANPPFLIAPDRDDPHRFGGGEGDALSREVTRGSAALLSDGGMAVVLCDFALRSDESWVAALTGWVSDTTCDALLLRLSQVSAAGYALANHDPRGYPSAMAFEAAVQAWVDHYRALGIDEIGSAVIVLRKRAGRESWVEGVTLAGHPTGPIGEHIGRMLDGIDAFRSGVPADLLRERLVLVEGHELRQRLHRVDSVYLPDAAQLHIPDLPLVSTVSAEGAPVLFALDGSCDLATAISSVADEYGLSEPALRDRLLPELHALAVRGILRRA